jgi:hypothetical protein
VGEGTREWPVEEPLSAKVALWREREEERRRRGVRWGKKDMMDEPEVKGMSTTTTSMITRSSRRSRLVASES